jgi:flagellar biosynthesis/type III secretory pathway protein FliH
MKQIRLPDGSYIHPAKIEKFDVAKHFWSSNYYVFAKLRGGEETTVAEKLGLIKAKEIRRRYEEELEKLHLESPPWENGYEIGKEEGFAEGRNKGIEEGKNRVTQINWNQAERNGIDLVLADIRARIEELYTEQNYDIKDERRRCVESTIKILNAILENFEPPPAEEPSADI